MKLPVLIIGVLAVALAALYARPEPAVPQSKPTPEMKAYEETVPGTQVKLEMVPIPGGIFSMGSPADEAGRGADEGPQHQVSIPPFWMGKMEVTWDEYDAYWRSNDQVPRPGTPAPEAKGTADAVTRPTPPYADETF